MCIKENECHYLIFIKKTNIMKKKTNEFKLRLNKETIANLDNLQMDQIYGGDGDGDVSRVEKLCGMELTVGVQVTCIGDKCSKSSKTNKKVNTGI